MQEAEDFPDARPRIWRAVDAMETENAVVKEKLKMLEDVFSRHLDFHDGMAKSLESIKSKLQENGEVLVAVKIQIDQNKKEIDSLWAFPLKLAGIIVAIFGASTASYKLIRWLLTYTDIHINR